MSIVKRGSYGFGFGYGKSKPVMNYHTTNSDSVTTVVAEISRLSFDEKAPCTGATVQKQNYATREEVCEEKVGGYGGAVERHSYGEQKAYQYGSGVGGYGASHHDSTGAALKHGYGEQKASYQHGVEAEGYGAPHHDSTGAQGVPARGYVEKVYQHGGDTGGYGALHHNSATQKHGAYGGHNAYQHAGDSYGEHKAYQQGCVDGVAGYDGFVQKSSAQKQYGYGGGHKATYDNAMQKQKHGYAGGQYAAYQPGCDDVAGYDALVINKAMQKQAATETYKHRIASKESEYSSDEESDCEEELAYGGKHAAGGNKLGTTHQYSAYQQHGDGGHYESYQSTTTQGYSGGGYGGLAQPSYF